MTQPKRIRWKLKLEGSAKILKQKFNSLEQNVTYAQAIISLEEDWTTMVLLVQFRDSREKKRVKKMFEDYFIIQEIKHFNSEKDFLCELSMQKDGVNVSDEFISLKKMVTFAEKMTEIKKEKKKIADITQQLISDEMLFPIFPNSTFLTDDPMEPNSEIAQLIDDVIKTETLTEFPDFEFDLETNQLKFLDEIESEQKVNKIITRVNRGCGFEPKI